MCIANINFFFSFMVKCVGAVFEGHRSFQVACGLQRTLCGFVHAQIYEFFFFFVVHTLSVFCTH